MICPHCGDEVKPIRKARHRLVIGDCTDRAVMAQAMGEEGNCQIVITDPPYNLGFDYGEDIDDSRLHKDYHNFLMRFFQLWSDISEHQLITPGKQNLALWLHTDWTDIGCWYKRNAMSGAKIANLNLWEPILFFGQFDRTRRASDFFEYNVAQQENVGSHPCPKILDLWIDLLEHYSNVGDIVADPFLGSGTTMVAAERLGRRCFGVEISPAYSAVVLERMSELGLIGELQ